MSVLCDFDREALASIHLDYLEMPEHITFQITGDKGWALLDYSACLLRLGNRADRKERQQEFDLADWGSAYLGAAVERATLIVSTGRKRCSARGGTRRARTRAGGSPK